MKSNSTKSFRTSYVKWQRFAAHYLTTLTLCRMHRTKLISRLLPLDRTWKREAE